MPHVKLETRRDVTNQYSEGCQSIGKKYDLMVPDAMCGFLALATALSFTRSDPSRVDESEQSQIVLGCVDEIVLPWIMRARKAYIESHLDEFVPEGTPWRDSGGRMSANAFQTTLAGTPELQLFIRTFGQDVDGSDHAQHEAIRRLRCVSLLRNILEGPAVNESSVRFPPTQNATELERLYLDEERAFYSDVEPVDFYVGTHEAQCVGVSLWAQKVYAKLICGEIEEQWILIDRNGHYFTINIRLDAHSDQFEDNRSDGDGVVTPGVLLTVYDSIRNGSDAELVEDPAVLVVQQAFSVCTVIT